MRAGSQHKRMVNRGRSSGVEVEIGQLRLVGGTATLPITL